VGDEVQSGPIMLRERNSGPFTGSASQSAVVKELHEPPPVLNIMSVPTLEGVAEGYIV